MSTLALLAALSSASAADVLKIDLTDTWEYQAIGYSSPTVPYTAVDLRPHIPANQRTAYTKAAPLALPCDVDVLAGGLAWKNVSSQPVYAEMSGALFVNGDEHVRLANVFGQVVAHAPEGAVTPAGALGSGGFIFLAAPPLYNFTVDPTIADVTLGYLDVPGYDQPGTTAFQTSAPGYLPANVPLKIAWRVLAFSDDIYDVARGGYSLADLVPDSVIWDECYTVWIERVCPGT